MKEDPVRCASPIMIQPYHHNKENYVSQGTKGGAHKERAGRRQVLYTQPLVNDEAHHNSGHPRCRSRLYGAPLSRPGVLSVVEEHRVQEISVGLSRLPGENSTRLLPLPSMLSQFLRSVHVALRLGP